MSGSTSDIETLLCSGSFEAFLLKIQMSQNMAEHDDKIVKEINDEISKINELTAEYNSMISDINDDKAALEQAKAELKSEKADVQSQEDKLDESKTDIDKKLQDCVAVINKINTDSAAYSKLIANYEAQQDDFDAEIDNIINEAAARAAAAAAKKSFNRSGDIHERWFAHLASAVLRYIYQLLFRRTYRSHNRQYQRLPRRNRYLYFRWYIW